MGLTRLTHKRESGMKSGYWSPNRKEELVERLAEYEDLEEQNQLLKLPCAVGDTVYTLNPLLNGKTVIGETTADAFFCALVMLEGRFGKTVFLTREESEAALKELERSKGE